jgi:hypothetical protein
VRLAGPNLELPVQINSPIEAPPGRRNLLAQPDSSGRNAIVGQYGLAG